MIESITNFLQTHGIPAELVIFIISVVPVLELRGGLIAAALLGVHWYIALPICFLGNMLPIPFVLLFIRKIFNFLKRNRRLRGIIEKFEAKTARKSKKIERGWLLGLMTFVAIPLPGTGAWTGALAADLFHLPLRRSLPVIALGVLIAGAIMLIISYFIPGLFGFGTLS